MKYIRLLLCFVIILILPSCTSTGKMNAHEFIKQLNKQSDYDISYENLSMTMTDMMTYSLIINDNILVCMYADLNGEILRCTVTAEKKTNEYTTACAHAVSVMTNAEPEQSEILTQKVMKLQSIDEKDYNFIYLSNEIGVTFIISSQEDDLCDITAPTLKRPVEEIDISRPAITPGDTTVAK